MRFGNCTTNPAEFDMLKQYGYSFIEANFQFVREMSEKEFSDLLQEAENVGIRVEGRELFRFA